MSQDFISLHSDESIHDLQLKGLKIIQKKAGFRFGMDAVLLSDFCRVHANDVIADFGTGTGIIPILLAGKKNFCHIHAFEIQNNMAQMAERSVLLNDLENKISVYSMDCTNAHEITGKNAIDVVISNPPYGEFGKTIINPQEGKALARHQTPELLNRFFKESYLILKGKGKIFIIYPVQSMFGIMNLLQKNHLEPKRFRLIYPFAYKPANLVMIEAVKDAKPGLLSLPPLIVYQKNKVYTEEVRRIYGIEEEVYRTDDL